MFIYRAVLISLLFGFSVASKAQTAETIIATYIQFTGGVKQWGKINSIVSSGTYNYGGMEFPFEAYSKAPDQYMYKVSSNGKYFAQALMESRDGKLMALKMRLQRQCLPEHQHGQWQMRWMWNWNLHL